MYDLLLLINCNKAVIFRCFQDIALENPELTTAFYFEPQITGIPLDFIDKLNMLKVEAKMCYFLLKTMGS